jgi:hypothetical protein
MWWHTPVIPATEEAEVERIMSFRPAEAKLARPYLKNKIKTKGLSNGREPKHKALGSIPSTAERKERQKEEGRMERKGKGKEGE